MSNLIGSPSPKSVSQNLSFCHFVSNGGSNGGSYCKQVMCHTNDNFHILLCAFKCAFTYYYVKYIQATMCMFAYVLLFFFGPFVLFFLLNFPVFCRSLNPRLQKASEEEKQNILEWINSLTKWPDSKLMEEYIKAHVESDNRTYYKDENTVMKDVVKRLHDIASKTRQSYVKKDGKVEFSTKVNSFWKRYLPRILSCKKVSGDVEMFAEVSRIFKLPSNLIDKHFNTRKREYILGKGKNYELGLERCTTCKTKTKVIGGSCILDSHQSLASALKAKKIRDKKLIEASKNKAVTVTCSCGCWANLRPGECAPKHEVKDDKGNVTSVLKCSSMSVAAIKNAQIAGRCKGHGHTAVDLSAIQIHEGKCDICSGIAGVKCSGNNPCTCIDGPYVLTHCKRHGFKKGRPKIESGQTLCNGCRDDIKDRSRVCGVSHC